jgi:phage terminase small subunit
VSELTSLQERAAQLYVLEGKTKSDAYREAGYSVENSTDKSVNELASALFANPKVSSRVEELRELQLKRQQVTIDRVVAEYAKLAFQDVTQIFYPNGTLRPLDEMHPDARAAISGIEVVDLNTEDEHISSQIKKIKLVDKKGALDSLANFLKMFVKQVEHTGKDGKELPSPVNIIVTQDAIKEQIKKLDDEY